MKTLYPVKYFITVVKGSVVSEGDKHACYLSVVSCTSQ